MKDGVNSTDEGLTGSEFEKEVIAKLKALYREDSVKHALKARTSSEDSSEPHYAYRKMSWNQDEHWALCLANEHIKPGGRVLVVGCGLGKLCRWLAEAGYLVTGIDILPEFIRMADELHNSTCRDWKISFVEVDGLQWPFDPNEFDCVAMMDAFLTQCPTTLIRGRLFSESKRVLKAEGCLLAEAIDRTHPAFEPPSDSIGASTTEPTLTPEISGESGVFIGQFHPFSKIDRAETKTAWYFADPEEIEREIEASKLRVIRRQTEQNQFDKYACVTFVAIKDSDEISNNGC